MFDTGSGFRFPIWAHVFAFGARSFGIGVDLFGYGSKRWDWGSRGSGIRADFWIGSNMGQAFWIRAEIVGLGLKL